MAISPGVILVPSNMIILSKMVSGYNNILTLAKSGMRFGKNSRVNYYRPVEPQVSEAKLQAGEAESQTGELEVGRTQAIPIPEKPTVRSEVYLAVITLIGGSLVSKFII